MKSLFILAILLVVSSPYISSAETDYLQQGATHLEGGRYKKAVRSYELAIKAQQDSAEAYKGIGLAYYKMGHNEHASDFDMLSTAVNSLNQSLAIKQDAEVYYTLGLSYLALDDKKKAESAHLNLKSINPDLADILAAKITAYGAPKNYILVRNPETERKEVMEALQRQEARKQAAKRAEAREIEELRDRVADIDSKKANKNNCPQGYVDIPSKGVCVITPAEEQRQRMEIYNNQLKVQGLDDESQARRKTQERIDELESAQRRLESGQRSLEFDNRRLESDKRQLELEKSRYRRH